MLSIEGSVAGKARRETEVYNSWGRARWKSTEYCENLTRRPGLNRAWDGEGLCGEGPLASGDCVGIQCLGRSWWLCGRAAVGSRGKAEKSLPHLPGREDQAALELLERVV